MCTEKLVEHHILLHSMSACVDAYVACGAPYASNNQSTFKVYFWSTPMFYCLGDVDKLVSGRATCTPIPHHSHHLFLRRLKTFYGFIKMHPHLIIPPTTSLLYCMGAESRSVHHRFIVSARRNCVHMDLQSITHVDHAPLPGSHHPPRRLLPCWTNSPTECFRRFVS